MTGNARGTRRAVTETDLELGDGRTLHVYDTSADGADGRPAVFWSESRPDTRRLGLILHQNGDAVKGTDELPVPLE